ncbi:transglutaminase-like protein [Rhizoctonia solani]|uniref:Transglutaminase-like protein n=1 Tax=Rhizoctonia solani TaxID=456999 RepID=A0A8H8SVQ1_9AGAM|nr:transglutaminase-like protein [Rhizoctonia solani]QRW18388.1 transglutaminase-like protein [Rhizoctonia solani]
MTQRIHADELHLRLFDRWCERHEPGYVQNSNEMLQRRKDAPEPALAEVSIHTRTRPPPSPSLTSNPNSNPNISNPNPNPNSETPIAVVMLSTTYYKQELAKITAARRRHRTPPELAQLEQEDKTEREWLAKSDQRAREGETEREAEAAAEPARESGTQEWKEARGEAGPGSR